MKTVGITGSMGAGKSTACETFAAMGVPIFEADQVVKNLYDTNPDLMIEMIKSFGADIYTGTKLNRKKLGGIIFNDSEKLVRVNKIITPFLKVELDDFCNIQDKIGTAPFVIMEAAIVYELGSQSHYDAVIYVTAPESVRIERIRERDNLSYDEIGARLRHFMPEEKKIVQADFVIDTFRPQVSLAEQCWEIYMGIKEERYPFMKASRWMFDGMNSNTLKDVKNHLANLKQYENAAQLRDMIRDIERDIKEK